ncbi:MAG: nucleotide disphospho-sugar-binding domain-containing protein, partial [Chloroflexota bacterium]
SSLLPIAEYDNSLPTVYFTLGTVFNIESGDLFSRVLAGLRNVEANIIVTVGKQINPEMFGSQPNNIHIAQFIPQAEILPHCDLVISHGGSGTVIATLAHGLPMILMPMGADQINNASRCQSLGFGEVLNVVTMTSSDIAETVNRVLADTNYRKVAEGLKAEMDKLPPPTHAVSLLERLSRNAQPIA